MGTFSRPGNLGNNFGSLLFSEEEAEYFSPNVAIIYYSTWCVWLCRSVAPSKLEACESWKIDAFSCLHCDCCHL